ncbi:MAG TPA: indole-3-glycerol phosphate synthase TrpC [Candidatus Paceibacterota bacterium]|nr:indole-3-glycerol phosphate synthase TrpC [Verrucomicrobiota bacterium]HRZ43667.1 indole-3-glycerol phosphate synthase TrpC [Candidatus Paceibacterota bacterium]HRZ91268.1 indole-3-glycerol phosphate synthase TrpC [Candidatus Paceibacterota bacterium]
MHILDTIVAEKRAELGRMPQVEVTAERLRAARRGRGAVRDFAGALRAGSRRGIALIAEVKKASPSAGVIRPDFDPVGIACEYAAAGADAISVLTDEKYFHGSPAYLRAIRAAVDVPLLRKDFVLDARQVLEAAEWGADAVLLIAAILEGGELRRLLELAGAGGLAALVEVHDEEELTRARAAGAKIIGVNNRDLRTFRVDLETTVRLGRRLRGEPGGEEILLVAESGIRTREDVQRAARGGASAILVGESLMRAADIRGAVEALLGDRPTK